MANRAVTVVAVLLLSTALCSAEWRVDGKAVPDTAWAKSSGEFGAQLVLTDRPEELFAAWEKPGPAVLLSETPTATRGVPIVAVIFFTGCARNERGFCDTTVRFSAFTPDGKPWGKPQDGELWTDKPPPGRDQIQLSMGNLGVIVEPGDPLGVYTIKAEVTDKIGKRSLLLERTFAAVEAGKRP